MIMIFARARFIIKNGSRTFYTQVRWSRDQARAKKPGANARAAELGQRPAHRRLRTPAIQVSTGGGGGAGLSCGGRPIA